MTGWDRGRKRGKPGDLDGPSLRCEGLWIQAGVCGRGGGPGRWRMRVAAGAGLEETCAPGWRRDCEVTAQTNPEVVPSGESCWLVLHASRLTRLSGSRSARLLSGARDSPDRSVASLPLRWTAASTASSRAIGVAFSASRSVLGHPAGAMARNACFRRAQRPPTRAVCRGGSVGWGPGSAWWPGPC